MKATKTVPEPSIEAMCDVAQPLLDEADYRHNSCASLEATHPKSQQHPSVIDYHVVVPIFNESSLLEQVLKKIKKSGYLDKVTFVNDASTDESGDILDRWRESEGIDVIHLAENRKKEGAIREALETLKTENRLTDKVVLLDADSFISPTRANRDLNGSIRKALSRMDAHNFAAMGFRYDIFLPRKPSLLQKAQYAEFAGLRFMNRVAPEQHQLWVINGRGGIFKSSVLLSVLQKIEPDFETGDILITQRIMANGHKISYYDKIKVETMDVTAIGAFSKQRRRWARGTTKVMFNERSYYLSEISRLSKVGSIYLLYVLVDIGIPLSVIAAMLLTNNPIDFLVYKLPIAMVVWTALSIGLAVSDKGIREDGYTGKIIRWSAINSFLYLFVTMPSRFAGLFDTVKYFVLGKRKAHPSQLVVEKDQMVDADKLIQNTTAEQEASANQSLTLDTVSQTPR